MSGFFISHVSREKSIALLLQKYLWQAFGTETPIFVSSDKTSIGGGKKWFNHILENIKDKEVILCLVSQESKSSEWINYEAGIGEGKGALVIPIAIKSLPPGAVGYPLAGSMMRAAEDISWIIDDIAQHINRMPQEIDSEAYVRELMEAEEKVRYTSVVIRPYKRLEGNSNFLYFEIESTGNTDVELLFAEATVCRHLFANSWMPLAHVNQLDVLTNTDVHNRQWVTVRYWTHPGVKIPRLVPVLTRSMGRVTMSEMRFALNRLGTAEEMAEGAISYQLHVRGYDTSMESVQLNDIERRD